MYLINEICDYSTQSQMGTKILESTQNSEGKPQVTIKTILQTCDDVNKNKRIYPKEILQKAVNDLKEDAKANKILGELDHPVPTGVSETDSYRHFVVLYDRASHIIQDMYFEGSTIMGIVKTTSTDKGYNMAGLIKDGVPVGFSLRAMGESEMTSGGITKIKEPFSMVTYDVRTDRVR